MIDRYRVQAKRRGHTTTGNSQRQLRMMRAARRMVTTTMKETTMVREQKRCVRPCLVMSAII